MSAPDESETVTPPVGDRQPTGGAIGQLGRRRGWVRGALDLVRSAALVILFFFLVRSLLVEAFKIPTSSMEFTLLAGDFLLVNKAAYGAEIPGLGLSLPALSEPDHGDVIVFHPPHQPDRHYVKRLVGLPGDTLQMRDKSLFVNGERISEPYVRYVDPDGDAVHPSMSWQATYLRDRGAVGRYRPSRDNWGPLVVPPERFFVLGDNRDNSEDSRYWGFVMRAAIKGRPLVVYYYSEPPEAGGLSPFGEGRWDRIGGLIR